MTGHGATPEPLLWSEQGALACRRHAPTEGSDTWRWGRWRPLTRAEVVEFEEELGHPPACESCEDARLRSGGGRRG